MVSSSSLHTDGCLPWILHRDRCRMGSRIHGRGMLVMRARGGQRSSTQDGGRLLCGLSGGHCWRGPWDDATAVHGQEVRRTRTSLSTDTRSRSNWLLPGYFSCLGIRVVFSASGSILIGLPSAHRSRVAACTPSQMLKTLSSIKLMTHAQECIQQTGRQRV